MSILEPLLGDEATSHDLAFPKDPWGWFTSVELLGLDHYFHTLEQSMQWTIDQAKTVVYPDHETNHKANLLKLIYEDSIPRNFRYSFVTLAFQTIENRLVDLCDSLAKVMQSPFSMNDLRGQNGLEKCKTFVNRTMHRQLANIPQWKFMMDLGAIRNCIVHASGSLELSRDTARLEDLIKQGIGLSRTFPDPGLLVIESDYCQQLLVEANSFFLNFFELVDWIKWFPLTDEFREYLATGILDEMKRSEDVRQTKTGENGYSE